MWLDELWRRAGFVLRRSKHLDEMEEEMRLHAELRAKLLAETVDTPQAAQTEAERQFGNPAFYKETAWHFWSFGRLESAWRDVTFAARLLRKDLRFTTVAVVTLALGIGAVTAMFSVIDNVLLEPFPYANQQRLYSLVIHDVTSSEEGGRNMFPAAELLDYREQNRIFDDVMGVGISRATWTTGGQPESINAPVVTSNAFELLGVPPVLGRWAGPGDVKPGAAAVCVMSYSFWQNRFGGDRDIIGKVLMLDGTPTTVIGVMPPRFVFWSADVWLPVALRRDQAGFPPPWFYLLGRLKPGLTVKAADRQIELVANHLADVYRPNLYPYKFEAKLQSFVDSSVGKFQRTLFTLLAAVGLLLLIACANVANLLIAKASSRRREFAIRSSLGAGWPRVVRQLFAESALLAVLGAGTGCIFAWAGLKLLLVVLPSDTFPDEAVISLNAHVLIATVTIAAATALFFGLVPITGGLRRDINEALKSGGREHSGSERSQFRGALIVGEVAMAMVLLVTAGVMMRSFLRERDVQLGLNPKRLLTAEIFLTKAHRNVAQQAQFDREIMTELRRAPGVLDVTSTSDFLPFGGAVTEFALPGRPHSSQYDGQVAMIDPGLFETLQVPILRGRNFTDQDVAGNRMIALVNQAFVQKFFPDKDPIGQRVQITTLGSLPEPIKNAWFEIVGVTANFKNRGLRQPTLPEAYVPYTVSGLGGFGLLVRAAGDPAALAKLLESTALKLDSTVVVRHIRTMESGLETEEYAKPRFGLRIFSVFASLGLILAGAGIYSLMSYTVLQRKREMGIRLALGATPLEVQTSVIRNGMRFVALGILAGLLLTTLVLDAIRSQIWQISAHDPITLLCAIGILALAGFLACYVPSLIALRVDPAATLRSE